MNAKVIDDPEERRRLRALAEKITALMKEHDVAGYVQLSGRHSAEYQFHLEPSWSCLQLVRDNSGTQVRFKAAIATGPATEKQRAEWTIGMVLMRQLFESHEQDFRNLCGLFGKAGEIDHRMDRTDPGT